MLGLSELSGALGPQLGGILIAFPVLASLLAGFTHASDGGPAAAALLRGMITRLIGFAGFCLVAALELRALGVAAGLLAAVAASLTLHATTLRWRATSVGLSGWRTGSPAFRRRSPR